MDKNIQMKNGTLEIDSDGTKIWRFNGKLHRLDGPAIIYPGGSKGWYINGKCHRLDGPACEYADGYKGWWINDINYTEYQFTNMILTSWRRLFS